MIVQLHSTCSHILWTRYRPTVLPMLLSGEFNCVRFCAYRTAMKLRQLQRKLRCTVTFRALLFGFYHWCADAVLSRHGSRSGRVRVFWPVLIRKIKQISASEQTSCSRISAAKDSQTSTSPSLLIYVDFIDIYEHNTCSFNVYCCIISRLAYDSIWSKFCEICRSTGRSNRHVTGRVGSRKSRPIASISGTE